MARKPKFKAPDAAVLDFETKPILPAPQYPPEPVGFSLWLPGEKRRYYGWGHPSENNCTKADGKRVLSTLWKSRLPIVCHHAKFDLTVAETFMGVGRLPMERIHDTVFLLFLQDPYRHGLDLKGAAEELLGMPPEERDAIRDWAIAQKLMPRTRKSAGEFIHLAPGKLVGTYADGDTLRTGLLFQMLWPEIMERGMAAAYDRERRLLPVLMDNEADGIPVNLDLLAADAKKFGTVLDAEKFGTAAMFEGGAMDQCDSLIRKALRAPRLNVDSDDELADALVKARKASEDGFLITPGGKRSVAKDSILQAVSDKKVLSLLQYRARLGTAKNTFLLPWYREALEGKEPRVRPSWNQVRQFGSAGDAGAKTGRLSASRFMNVPKPFLEKAGKFEHPHWSGLPELPLVRRYLLPERGHVWCKRDYAQQELRVLAHFENGVLLDNYHQNPDLDVHQLAASMLVDMGYSVTRDDMKTIGFGLIYGMGLGALAERLQVDVATAKQLKAVYLSIFPGLSELITDLTAIGKQGESMRTWGGREYFVEPPVFSKKYNRVQSFEYKLINFLIQGSSADCTKEALIRYADARRDGIFKVTVHDEINISVPTKAAQRELLLLRDVMASVEFDVTMLSDGSVGPNWGELTKLKEPRYDAANALYRRAA